MEQVLADCVRGRITRRERGHLRFQPVYPHTPMRGEFTTGSTPSSSTPPASTSCSRHAVQSAPASPQVSSTLALVLPQASHMSGGARFRATTEGRFTATLGAGNWLIQTSGHQGSYYCAQETVFQVQAGKLTKLCIDMNCN